MEPRTWIKANKENLVKYKEYLNIRYNECVRDIVHNNEPTLDLLRKGQARLLEELISEL